MRSYVLTSIVLAATAVAGCGAAPATADATHARQGVGAIHAVAQTSNGSARTLSVEYAAAGISGSLAPDDAGSLVIVGVFRDGRVDDSLDLETLSINVPLSALPGSTGTLDTVVGASDLTVLLEGSAGSETRLLAPDSIQGSLHLRYDAPPRPGITLRGDFSLVVDAGTGRSSLKLEGEFEVPVLGG